MPTISLSALVKGSALGESTSSIAAFKVREKHQAGMCLLRGGFIYDAIQLFQEASFFDAENVRPIVALAECYVFLCDLRSAVRCYRRALLSLHKKELNDYCRRCNEVPTNPVDKPLSAADSPVDSSKQSESELPKDDNEAPTAGMPNNTQESLEGRLTTATDSDPVSSASDDDGPPVLSDPEVARDLQPPETAAQLSDLAAPLETPATVAVGEAPEVTPNPPEPRAVLTVKEISRRLAGVLDALGLSLYQVGGVEQALRCTTEALELLDSVARGGVQGVDNSATLLRAPHLLADATIALHHGVYLMALRRDEDAEALFEKHFAAFVNWRPQTAALLIQLYCNRQAFRKARVLLEMQEAAAAGTDPTKTPTEAEGEVNGVTSSGRGGAVALSLPSREAASGSLEVAKYLFTELYARYRTAALASNNEASINCCLGIYSNDVDLLYRRAQLKLAAGEHKKSVKDFFRCLRETNGEHKGAIEAITAVLFKIGSSLQGEADMQDAVTYYSESLKWRPDNLLVLLARGDCYTKMESFEEALADYEAVLCFAPEQPEARQRIASLRDLWGRKLFAQNQPEQAEAEFTNAIKTDPQNPQFYYHRALCRLKLNQGRYALRDVLSCKELNPTAPHLRAFIARYLEPVQPSEAHQRGKAFPMATKQASLAPVRAAPCPSHRGPRETGRLSPLVDHDEIPALRRRRHRNMSDALAHPMGGAPSTAPTVLPWILCPASSRKHAALSVLLRGRQTTLHPRESGASASVQ
ncbi:hypothetical protein JKF63_00169 [Porcisia hertigi]|uniref:Uncharacterized protein n=1 Tax=Porcisia hertigi TaxID=2761500 RepID=A0A836HT53_9TRYP|nr:hypothetical protein JKF63_00169 [Porcisia hertigi]